MANPQKRKFSGIPDFLACLPPEEYDLVTELRTCIYDTLPMVNERLAYNVPFYYGRRRLAYLWPASVPWGKITEGVKVGFVHANRMESIPTVPGQTMGALTYLRPGDIDFDLLRYALEEAYRLDQHFK